MFHCAFMVGLVLSKDPRSARRIPIRRRTVFGGLAPPSEGLENWRNYVRWRLLGQPDRLGKPTRWHGGSRSRRTPSFFGGNQTGRTEASGSVSLQERRAGVGPDFFDRTWYWFIFIKTSSCPVSFFCSVLKTLS